MVQAAPTGVTQATPAAAPVHAAAEPALKPANLGAEAIVQRNLEARGGQVALQQLQTVTLSGKMDAGGNNQRYLKVPGMPPPPPVTDRAAQVELPFTLNMKRGHKSRLELQFNGQTAVQVYDGSQGWKLRPFLNRHEVEPYTAEEARLAAEQPDLDGLLAGYAARGTRIEVEGMEAVDGKSAYRLKLTGKDGRVVHDWVDAQSFLEVKIEGTPRRLDGRMHPVEVYLRDYRSVAGVQIPHLIETRLEGVERTERIVVEKAAVNVPLDDGRFAKPS
ncbi:MAG: outer membrane lipoprotein-sorting protein [Proteobacteria bacterium]|nr:outer membrane lipoprotein-sorting protein [Pseudomonadota bacterium]